jgi:hypothetical protein
MAKSSHLQSCLFLLLSLTPMVYGEGDTVILAPASNDSPNEILRSLTQRINPLDGILKNIISAAFIHECEAHTMNNEMNATVHASRIDTTLSSTIKNNRIILIDRIRRFVFGREPKIIITSTTTLQDHDHSLEGEIINIIKEKMFDLAKADASICQEKKDGNGKVLTCRIVHTLKEFAKLKEHYNSLP